MNVENKLRYGLFKIFAVCQVRYSVKICHEIYVALQRTVMVVNVNVFLTLFALQYKKASLYDILTFRHRASSV